MMSPQKVLPEAQTPGRRAPPPPCTGRRGLGLSGGPRGHRTVTSSGEGQATLPSKFLLTAGARFLSTRSSRLPLLFQTSPHQLPPRPLAASPVPWSPSGTLPGGLQEPGPRTVWNQPRGSRRAGVGNRPPGSRKGFLIYAAMHSDRICAVWPQVRAHRALASLPRGPPSLGPERNLAPLPAAESPPCL